MHPSTDLPLLSAPSAASPTLSRVASPRGHTLPQIQELDGLRGLAALWVFLFHVAFLSVPASIALGPMVHGLYQVASFGFVGVDIFFILSGFLITAGLLQTPRGANYYHTFYWKRALRILPLYLLTLGALWLFVPGSTPYVLLSCCFIANFAWPLHVQTEGPFWTLSIEEQFYILWPTLVRRASITQVKRLAVGIAAGAVLLRLLASCFGYHNYFFTFFHCDGLALGAFLACIYDQTGSLRAVARWLWLALIVGLGLLAFAPTEDSHGLSVALSAALRQTGVTWIGFWLVGMCIAWRGHWSTALLRTPLLVALGALSYAFYLLHLYVMTAYDRVLGPQSANHLMGYSVRLAAILTATLLVAVVSRYAIERPALSLRRYLLKAPAKPDLQAA